MDLITLAKSELSIAEIELEHHIELVRWRLETNDLTRSMAEYIYWVNMVESLESTFDYEEVYEMTRKEFNGWFDRKLKDWTP